MPDRICVEVRHHRSGEGERDDQRGRGEIGGAHRRVDAALEVAVSRKDGGHEEVLSFDRVGHLAVERPRVADTRGTAVAGNVESECRERLEESSTFEVGGDDTRSGSEARLDPRGDAHATCDGVPREQPSGDHHRGIRGVGAGGDRRDGNRAVAHLGAVHGRAAAPLPGAVCIRSLEPGAEIGECDSILGSFRTGKGGDDRSEIDLHHLVVDGIGPALPPETLGPGVGLDECDLSIVAPGDAEIVERDLVDREERGRRTELRRHVGDRRPIGERDAGESVAERLDVCTDHSVSAESFGHREDQVCRRGACRQRSNELESDDLRQRREERLAEQHRLRLDPAHAEAEHPEARDHRGVRVGADACVGEGERRSVDLLHADDRRKALQVHLMHDACPRGDDAEAVECALCPSKESIAFLVALVLSSDVQFECVRSRPAVDLDRVVDDEIGGHLGVDALWIDAEFACGVAQGSEIDDGRDAGEVLQHDTRRREGQLAFVPRCRGRCSGPPCEIRVDIFGADHATVGAACRTFDEDLQDDGEARPRRGGCGESLERDAVGETRPEGLAHRSEIEHRTLLLP